MTQEIYQKAIKFAGEKHKSQKVPSTESNYFLHISSVAMEIILAHKENDNFDMNYAVQLALLHDTLEDTKIKFTELKEHFGQKVALELILKK
ncbi:MAG: HD domain-containing protein [Bacteroidota bacterium]